MDRSSGRAGRLLPRVTRRPDTRLIACYPPVWGIDHPTGTVQGVAREASLRTVVSTEAIATCLGASALIYGDHAAALCDPYYPKHARLTAEEAATVIAWRRFALRCRDLFLEGEDTSWYEIDDENGAVAVETAAPVRPEPVGGAVFARVVHAEDRVTVGVVDLTGSQNGRWSEPTAKGGVSSVRLTVLLDHPEQWQAEAAVLGPGTGRFAPVVAREVPHRRGPRSRWSFPWSAGGPYCASTREKAAVPDEKTRPCHSGTRRMSVWTRFPSSLEQAWRPTDNQLWSERDWCAVRCERTGLC